MYTALVLTPVNQISLIKAVAEKIGENDFCEQYPETLANHCTINMGSFDQNLNPGLKLGDRFKLKVISLSYDNKVIAVGVELPPDVKTKNNNPHITVAVNRPNGGKPFFSNKLDWNNAEPLTITLLNVELQECN